MRAHNGSDAVAVRRARFFQARPRRIEIKTSQLFRMPQAHRRCNRERSWWLLSNDKRLRSATARTLWKKGESSAPSVFHAFLGAICERALNLYVCRGGALWLAYHRTQTQSATQWECLFNSSTDIDSYYSYDTRTRQKCFIRTGYSFQPSIRLNSSMYVCMYVCMLNKIINATLLFLPPFYMSGTQRSTTSSMHTIGLFLSNIVHKSV